MRFFGLGAWAKSKALRSAFVFMFPGVAAVMAWAPYITTGLSCMGVLWAWANNFYRLAKGEGLLKKYKLETMSASSFSDKVRWCMDQAGIDYDEEVDVAVVGIFLLGRSVPRLHVRYNAGGTAMGNSSDILKYLYGKFNGSMTMYKKVEFMQPTVEAVALEERMDAFGENMQNIVYYHLLKRDPEVAEVRLEIWGLHDMRVPQWQRLLLKSLSPVLRQFMLRKFKPMNYGKNHAEAEALMSEMESRLQDGRPSLLPDRKDISYVDISFAVHCAVWIVPPLYGGPRMDPSILAALQRLPREMQEQRMRWMEQFPLVYKFVMDLYATRGAKQQ